MSARPLSADTTPEAAFIQQECWRQMAPAGKLALVRALTQAVLRLENVGIRRREPSLDNAGVFRRAASQRLGVALAARIYGPADRGRG